MKKKELSTFSYEVKTEILEICEAFNLGSLVGLISYQQSETVKDYLLTEFKTTKGIYKHWYKLKN